MQATYEKYASNFSDDGFWSEVARHAKNIGGEAIHKAICLWLVIKEGNAPVWAKTTAMGALGYLITPLDLIPDMLPGGFVDDVGVVVAAFTVLAAYITDDIQRKARQRMPEWLRD